ncbi:hypothetical protein F4814DRAFT_453157 [Daldinia grandis]|nr:hypothetical protein F4814DRAFT_453157 [Daldinia grandis]
MPPVTPTKASAVLSRGLTRSHTNIPPFPSTPSPLPRFSWSPVTPPTPPTPTIPYNPTPIRTPIFSPIRSPFSPLAPFPATPSPPSPIVSPFSSPASKAPSPLAKFLASMRARNQRRGARRGTNPPPKPKTLCPGCDRVKMLLPAKWCGHQVTPSRMQNGLRVVRIPKNFPNDKATLAKKARISELAKQAKAKPVTTKPTREKRVKAPIANSPVAKPITPKRAIVEAKPEPSIESSPLVRSPFKNPDLNDKPLHWSPHMFKPEIDRYNWTWSDWDSPSREIEDVSYQTTDWPIHNPFAAFPPHIREKFEAMRRLEKQLLEQQPGSSITAGTVHYEEVNIASLFSSGASTRSKRSHSKNSGSKRSDSKHSRSTHPHSDSTSSSEFSSWVDVNSRPWPPHILQMFNEGEEERKEWAAKRRNQPAISPLSESISKAYIPLDSPKPFRKPSPEPTHSSGLSSLLQLYVESDSDRQRWQTEKEKDEEKEKEEQEEKELLEMVARAKEAYAHESSLEGSATHSNPSSFASYNSDVANQYARSIQQIMQDFRAPSTAAPAPAPSPAPAPVPVLVPVPIPSPVQVPILSPILVPARSPVPAPSPIPTPSPVLVLTPSPVAVAASPIHDSPPKSPTTHSDSYGSYNSDVALQYAGSIQQILRDLRAPSAAEPATDEPATEPTPIEPTPAEPTHNSSFGSQDTHSNSYGSYNSDVANKYAGSIQQILQELRGPPTAKSPAEPTDNDSFESQDTHSNSYGSYNSDVANKYAGSIQQIMRDLRASSAAGPAVEPTPAEPTPTAPTPAKPTHGELTHDDSFESQDAHSNSYGSYNSDVANKYAGSIQQIMRDLRASSAAEPAAAPAPVVTPEATSALPTYDDSFGSQGSHSNSYGSYNSDVANKYAGSIQQIMRDLRASSSTEPAAAPELAASPGPVAAPEATTSVLPTCHTSFESPNANSDTYGSYNSDAANQYARSIQQIMQDLRASSTAPPVPAPASVSSHASPSGSGSGSGSTSAPSPSQHFFAKRQLPSAFALERPRPLEVPSGASGSGFGWKSLACVGVAAAAVGAGLAYAWLSFAT